MDPAQEAEMLAEVLRNSYAIIGMEDPPESVQIAAVTENFGLIGHIPDPSEAVMLAAVQNNWEAIFHMDYPLPEEVQLAAVAQTWQALYILARPCDKARLAGVKQCERAINVCPLGFLEKYEKELLDLGVTHEALQERRNSLIKDDLEKLDRLKVNRDKIEFCSLEFLERYKEQLLELGFTPEELQIARERFSTSESPSCNAEDVTNETPPHKATGEGASPGGA